MDGGRWGLRRFLWYCLYSWGCSLAIALAAVVVELLPPSYNVIRPNFTNDFCWFSDWKSLWLYLYMWVSVVVVANIVFFGMVIVILVKGQNNSLLRRSREMHRERMWLYVKLFLVMGVTWVAEMVSYRNGRCVGWIFTDIINALQGLTLFLVFILSRNAVRKIREKCGCGTPQSPHSRTGTTTSSLSSSSTTSKRLNSNHKVFISSRLSNTSSSIKDVNTETATPLNTLSEVPEDSYNDAQKGNGEPSGREEGDHSLNNGDAERSVLVPPKSGEAAEYT